METKILQLPHILVHTFRNRIEHFEDDVIGVWAGLWNLVLSYCGTTLLALPKCEPNGEPKAKQPPAGGKNL
jgi:hypothetical protein